MCNARRRCWSPLSLHARCWFVDVDQNPSPSASPCRIDATTSPVHGKAIRKTKAFHGLCLEVEEISGGTLPSLLLSHVVDTLATAEEPPFHLSDIAGVVVLDTAPDFSEREQDLLLAISSFCPVHQLLNPGSFRLGFHGAYLVDESPCTKENMPALLSSRTVVPLGEQLADRCRPAKENANHISLTLDERPHAMNAALALIQAYRAEHEGRILVIDAAVRDRANEWANALASIGMAWQPGLTTLNQQPLHQALVRAAGLAQGMSAWSLSSLRSLFFSSTVPFLDDMFPGLEHSVKRRGKATSTRPSCARRNFQTISRTRWTGCHCTVAWCSRSSLTLVY